MEMPKGIAAAGEALRHQVAELESRLDRARSVIDRLTETEFRQNELLALVSDAVYVQQRDRVVFANPAAARLHGFDSPRELVGMGVSDLIPTGELKKVLSRREQVTDGAQPPPAERMGKRRDGSTFICETRGSRIVWEGEPAVLVLLRDVTERKRAEQEAAAKSALAETTLEIMGHGYSVFDADAKLVAFNRKYVEVYQFPTGFIRLGMSHGEIIRGIAEKGFFGPGDVDAQVAARVASANAGEPRTNEFTTPLGRTYLYQRRPMPNGGFVATYTDITDRKRAEQALHESEARYRGLIENSTLPIQISTADRSFLYVNRAYLDLLGYDTLEEFFERRAKVIAPRDRDRIIAMADARKRGEQVPDVYEYDAVRKDGRIVPLQSFSRNIVWEGKPAFQRTLIDLTERKDAERALFESEEKLRKAFESTGIGVIIRNTADRSLICNDAICAMLGCSREELEAHHIAEFTHPDDNKKNERLRARLAAGETDSYQITKRLIRKDGEVIWTAQDMSAVRDERGEILFKIALYQDLTETKKAEEQLRQAQKMEAVGQLTGGVAHDFNNLLTVIQGNLGMIAGMATNSEVHGLAHMALKAAKRGAQLTHRLLAFSRRQQLAPEVIRLDALVADMSEMMRRTLGETIEIDVAGDQALWRCEADPGQLENAILNLALNARDAMPQGGRLAIRTENAAVGERDAAARQGVPPGDYVTVAVGDSGCGMPAEDLEHVFEPFFTTKPVGTGSGLGLSMVHGFISQSNGFVTIDSTVGSGTTVKMYLPRTGSAPETAHARTAATEPVSRGELVLVVEDDPDVRDFTVTLLRSLGYETVEAGDGPEAVEVLRDTADIRLLFCDVVLPGDMNGVDIAREAARLVPGIKVLLTSGYPDDVLARQGPAGEALPIVAKPFQVDDLARDLRILLDGAAA